MFHADGRPEMIAVSATVTRADGTVEDLGVIAYQHRSPLRMLLWHLGRLRRRRAGRATRTGG